jgi:serine/threonine protein kinase
MYWKATDETLARSVTVLTFATGFPRVAEVITAARVASRLNDPRFPQVFDVEEADDLPYVVMEWVVGESLLDMLSEGPLDPPRAVALVLEAAQAVTAAHAAGLAHLRLDPACLHWTPGGGVKIAGLGIDVALTGPGLTGPGLTGPGLTEGEDAEDPSLADTRDLARLLYAALTGYWPGQPGSAGSEPGLLPPAPETDGNLCTPRQVSAGVPAGVDAVTCQALFQRPSRYGPALSTPAMFADALASVAPPVPIPFASSPASPMTASTRGYGPNGTTNPYPAADTAPGFRDGSGYRRPPSKRSAVSRTIIGVVVVLVLVVAGVAGWTLTRGSRNSASPAPGRTQSTSPAATAVELLKPVGANSFDVYGNDGGNEDAAAAPYAIDGSTSTAWHTDYYFGSSTFGNLKPGTGLILNMGKKVRLSQVKVQFGTSCCTHVEIEIGNDATPDAAALRTFTALQSSDTAAGVTTFNVSSDATGQYVLIWITDLPPRAGYSGQYQALIYNVILQGSAPSQSG